MIDTGWYLDVVGFAGRTGWLNGIVIVFSQYGLILEGLAIAALLWRARHRDDRALAAALWVPIAVGIAYALDSVVKQVIAEPRPCNALANVATILPCDAHTDYSFPSNHTVIAAAFAAALVLSGRRWWVLATIYAVLMGASRVYIGAHYPHDVAAGLLVGALVGLAGLPLAGLATSSVTALRARRLLPAVSGPEHYPSAVSDATSSR